MTGRGVRVLTVTVDAAGIIVVRCPVCIRKHTVSVAKFKGKQTIIKVRCHCGELFALELEFGNTHPTPTSYSGRFENCSQGHSHGHMQILAMTAHGMEFTTVGRSTIRKGNKLKIDYHDPAGGFKKKKKNVIVSAVQGNRVSCYFVS